MAHGYLGDGYGVHRELGPDRGDERSLDRRERNWREGNESGRNPGRNRGTMLGDRMREEDWSDRSWRSYGPQSGSERLQSELVEGRHLSANSDDHYRSWRERHMSELDRDYEEYCREREQQFHDDFDAWRSQRRASPQSLRTGMTQTGPSADPTGQTQAEAETSPYAPEAEDPTANATLGTTSRRRGKG